VSLEEPEPPSDDPLDPPPLELPPLLDDDERESVL
jgi:hypothetical protein